MSKAKELLIYLTYFLTEVAGYAETDSFHRRAKHLPSQQDLNVSTKLAGNEVVWKIREDASFQTESGKTKPALRLDKDLVRKVYGQLTETPEYKTYISTAERNSKAERDI